MSNEQRKSILQILYHEPLDKMLFHERVLKAGRAIKREREGSKSTKREADNVSLQSDKLALRVLERRQRDV